MKQPPRLSRLDILAGQPGGQGWVDGALVAAHFQEPWAITGDGAGRLYVADGNLIRAIDQGSGTLTTLAGVYATTGSSDGVGTSATFSLPSGLAFADGQLYLSDTENHTIRKIDIASGATTTIAGAVGQRDITDGNAADARFGEPEGIALDGNGSLFICDTDNNTIRVLALGAGTVATVAGDPNAPGGLVDGVGTAATFYKPKALAIDASGNLYVADAFDLAVRKVVPSTRTVSTLATFQSVPQGLAVDGGDVLVSLEGVGGESRIARVNANGVVTTVAGSVTVSGFVDGVGADARFSGPAGLFRDGSGSLYIADAGNFALRKMTLADAAVSTYAGASSIGSADGTGSQARFSAPLGLALDDTTVYVADTGNDTIRAVELSTGKVTTLAGTAGQAGHVDGPLAGAQFHTPEGLALDSGSHTLYVADTLNRTIRKIDLGKGVVAPLAYVSSTFQGLDAPAGLALDSGRLFVSDFQNQVVAAIDLQSLEISALAGRWGMPGTSDGVGASAAFYGPQGLTADGRGNLYVADNQGCAVRKIEIATGSVTTVAGTPGQRGSNDGTGAAARFSLPFGASGNGLGDLFVSDTLNNTVRHVEVTDGTVTTVVGTLAAFGVRLGPLPGQLTQPSAVALTTTGGLLIVSENAVLIAH